MTSWIEEENKLFPNMVTLLHEGESERFKLECFEVTESDVKHCQMLDRIHARMDYDGLVVGWYVRLRRKDMCQDVVMSDTWMEKRSNRDVLDHANGNVLIAGLGIGMVFSALTKKPEVTHITVVEKEQEVIDLVGSQFHYDNVTIVHSDIHNYETTEKFDTIYFDIWDNICGDSWQEIKSLQKKFKRNINRKNPMWWMSSWKKDEIMHLSRRG
jgi:hypothetical protein